MFGTVLFPASVTVSATERQLPIYNVEKEEKVISISFDAAWGAEDTDTLIEILDQYQVKATFFVVGQWVDAYPDEVKKLAEAGHEVMNHSNTHPYLTQCDQQTMAEEITTCNEKIAAITGVTPTLIRCPYGDYNDTVIETIRSLGMEPIQWSVDSLDWKEISAEEITDRVLGQIESGSIVLFHNAALHTPEALPGILEQLLSDGYTIVPISELIIQGDYTIDAAGCQHSA
jgi:polysaccharide deacetylase family sporulation protein PdaB